MFRKTTAHRQRPIRPRLQLEQLEDRWCPSSYSITDLGVLDGISTGSTAYAINSAGQVVGASGHAFLWTPGGTSGVPGNPQMQDLGTLPGFAHSEARALNDAGQVTGRVSDPTTDRAFFWQSGVGMSDLGNLGADYAVANGMNNPIPNVHPVQVVGESRLLSGDNRPFVWQDLNQNGLSDPGEMLDLNALIPANSGWVLTTAYGINDNQQIVGGGLHNGVQRAFVWQVGSAAAPTDLGVLSGYAASSGTAINQIGQVSGNLMATGVTGTYPFLWTNGAMTALPLLRGTKGLNNHAFGLNNAAQPQVVGDSFDVTAAIPNRAVLWQSGKVYELTKQIAASAGWSNLDNARGIDDAGRIVGGGSLASGAHHAFLLTPNSHALTAAGLPGTVVAQTLDKVQVAPLLTEALHRWQTIGVNTSGMGDIRIQITNLGGLTLGLADERHHTIRLDDNAAGWGWFVDRTPGDDTEFTTPGDQGEQNRIDLLTVLEHEVGHLLGYEHADSGVMIDTLPAGTRRTPGAISSPLVMDATYDWLADEGWPGSHPAGRVRKTR
jgi:probable HAF family extracellular repeat protein